MGASNQRLDVLHGRSDGRRLSGRDCRLGVFGPADDSGSNSDDSSTTATQLWSGFLLAFGLISQGEQDAVSVLLGENSWNYMGTRQYSAGQRYGHGTGPVIGVSDVYSEDSYMADVLLNRVAQWGGTLSSQASDQSQFNGYGTGAQMFRADIRGNRHNGLS